MTPAIEYITGKPAGCFKFAVFDFDGTISLIREGWQGIMIPYFTDELASCPEAKSLPRQALNERAREFITDMTGKQTIYQCIRLTEEMARLGKTPMDAQYYKDEYQRRLLIHIDARLKGLETGATDPESLTVPGSFALLEALQRRDITCFLASGTDEEHVRREARLLGVDKYFGENIYGAQRDYATFSKKLVIERILRENDLSGDRLIGFGDGCVEIENIRDAGGFAVGVASDEAMRRGIDEWKRARLIAAGADVIIPDYRDIGAIESALFN